MDTRVNEIRFKKVPVRCMVVIIKQNVFNVVNIELLNIIFINYNITSIIIHKNTIYHNFEYKYFIIIPLCASQTEHKYNY